MEEVEIKFEREDLTGVIPVGTYLFDAARRMGVEVECERLGESDSCAVRVTGGRDLLSDTTKAENEQLTDERRTGGERLACQAKIERAGEIKIMTTKKEEPEKPDYEAKKETYRKEFQDLPLEKKIASLVDLEVIALGETFSFIINSPSMIVGKLMDVLAEFGLKMDDEAKKQTRPAEHQAGDPQPSVKDEPQSKDPKPSVKEETQSGDPKPSVKEESPTADPQPSVKEEVKTTKKKEPPPPSV